MATKKNLFLHLREDPLVFAFSCYIYIQKERERGRKREREERETHTQTEEKERERERERFTSVTRVPALSPALSVLIILLPLRATLTCLPRLPHAQISPVRRHFVVASSRGKFLLVSMGEAKREHENMLFVCKCV
jgi:hypothetical protein